MAVSNPVATVIMAGAIAAGATLALASGAAADPRPRTSAGERAYVTRPQLRPWSPQLRCYEACSMPRLGLGCEIRCEPARRRFWYR